MKVTVNIDDELLATASEISGISDSSTLINLTLDAYIKKMAARNLAALGGTMPELKECGTPARSGESGGEIEQ